MRRPQLWWDGSRGGDGGGGEAGGGGGWIDGPLEASECVIQTFLEKFTDEKQLVANRPTDQRTNGRIEGHTLVSRCGAHLKQNVYSRF